MPIRDMKAGSRTGQFDVRPNDKRHEGYTQIAQTSASETLGSPIALAGCSYVVKCATVSVPAVRGPRAAPAG